MEKNTLKVKRRQSRVIAIASAILIILLFGLNLLLTYVGLRNQLFIDTTYEGLYTLTDLMKDECSFVDTELSGDTKVEIIFCAQPDALVSYEITRPVYFMALQLANEFENIEVKEIDVAYNPTAVSKYKPTSLSEIVSGDVIISYGGRYRVVSANNFWVSMSGEIIAFNGEYKMASLIKSVTAVDRPKAYFVSNHGETYYDSSVDEKVRPENVEAAYLQDMLTDRGLETAVLDLSAVDKIPDDCVLLIINNPKTDYIADKDSFDEFGYLSETEKIDRYLVEGHGSVMVAKDHEITLPNLEEFLYEWGFDFSTSIVKDESAFVADETDSYSTILGSYDTETGSYGYAIYGDLASLSSAPSTVFSNTGYITSSYGEYMSSSEAGTHSVTRSYAPFLYSSDGAMAYEKSESGYNLLENAGKMHLSAVTTRLELDSFTGEYKYSYLFCANSGEYFSNEILGNASFSNYEVMSALTENMIRSDEYASIELGSTSANSMNQGGKLLLDTTMYATDYYENEVLVAKGLTSKTVVFFTVLVMLVPVVIGALGIAVRIRRRFL